jgi:hypothetical protein
MASAIRKLHPGTREGGQALVVMLGVMMLSIVLLAVIIDGGNVLTQQRMTQTGSDSTAEAGAVVFASKMVCDATTSPAACTPAGGWDAEVLDKLAESADANKMTVEAAYYTDICGIPLRSDGGAALNPDGTENLAVAMQVGNGNLPGGAGATPDCPSLKVGPPAGVLVLGHKDVGAFVAGAIGVTSFSVTTRATAVAGYLQGYCAASQSSACAVLPITIPVNAVICDGQNDVQEIQPPAPWAWNTVLTVPLCKANPGNVGWLDWDVDDGGGAAEIVCSIVNPDNPPITLPSWQFVAQTGNTNGGGPCVDDDTGISYSGVEEAVRKYDGQVVLIPQFDNTCRTRNSDPDPDSSQPTINTEPNYGCPNAPGGGTGQNIWYKMPSFAYLQLCAPSDADCGGRHGAYIQGNDSSVCDTGNGATSCLVGRFVDILSTGTVGAGGPGGGTGSKALGVQLIK